MGWLKKIGRPAIALNLTTGYYEVLAWRECLVEACPLVERTPKLRGGGQWDCWEEVRGTGQWDCAVITPIRGIPADQSSTSHTYMTSGGDKVASGRMIRKRWTRFYVIFKTIISIMVNRLFSYWLPFAGLLLSESTKKIDPWPSSCSHCTNDVHTEYDCHRGVVWCQWCQWCPVRWCRGQLCAAKQTESPIFHDKLH